MKRQYSPEHMRQYPVSVLSVASTSRLTPGPSNPYNPLLVYNRKVIGILCPFMVNLLIM